MCFKLEGGGVEGGASGHGPTIIILQVVQSASTLIIISLFLSPFQEAEALLFQ